jgi:hypothetical protein
MKIFTIGLILAAFASYGTVRERDGVLTAVCTKCSKGSNVASLFYIVHQRPGG